MDVYCASNITDFTRSNSDIVGNTIGTASSSISDTESSRINMKASPKISTRRQREKILNEGKIRIDRRVEEKRKQTGRMEADRLMNGWIDDKWKPDLRTEDTGFYIDMTEVEPKSGKLNRKTTKNISGQKNLCLLIVALFVFTFMNIYYYF